MDCAWSPTASLARSLRLLATMLWTSRLALLVVIATTPAVLEGCELESCTVLGCGPALSVELGGGQQEPGEYEITITADGVETTCSATLPFASCELAVSCDRSDPGFSVLHSGCALGTDEHRLDGIEWYGAAAGPEQISVEVRLDGTLIGSGSGAPAYDTFYPNGEDCGPACQQTDEVVTITL